MLETKVTLRSHRARRRPRHKAEDDGLWRVAKGLWGLAIIALAAFVVLVGIQASWKGRTTPYVVVETVPATEAPVPSHSPSPQPKPSSSGKKPESFEYATCASASKAGALPLRKGKPGYSKSLDTDNDGRACENYKEGNRG